jgi:hypothetical protein
MAILLDFSILHTGETGRTLRGLSLPTSSQFSALFRILLTTLS